METNGNNERNKKLKILPNKKLKMENWKKLKNRKKRKKAKKIYFDGSSEKHSLLMVETTDCWISISDWEVDGRCDDIDWPIPGFFTSACCAYSNGCIRWMNSEQYIIFLLIPRITPDMTVNFTFRCDHKFEYFPLGDWTKLYRPMRVQTKQFTRIFPFGNIECISKNPLSKRVVDRAIGSCRSLSPSLWKSAILIPRQ